MSDAYEYTVGVLNGPEAEARGCRKPWDFSDWQPDIVCIRLLTNDNNGMIERQSFEEDREKVILGAVDLIRKVRRSGARTAEARAVIDRCLQRIEELTGRLDTLDF